MNTSKIFSVKKGFAPILIIILIIAAVIIASGAYYFSRKSLSSSNKGISSSIPNLASAETAIWKTYTNSTHNYTIKYPNTWETYTVVNSINGHSDSNEVETEKNGVFQQAFQKIGPHTTLEPIAILTNKSTPTFDFAYTTKAVSKYKGSSVLKNIKIDGIDALRRDNMQEIELSEVLFQKDNFIYRIVLTKPEYEDTFNKMIDTIKFTN